MLGGARAKITHSWVRESCSFSKKNCLFRTLQVEFLQFFVKVEVKSPKFSPLAPSALANVFFLFCVAGARSNHTFVNAWIWLVFKNRLFRTLPVEFLQFFVKAEAKSPKFSPLAPSALANISFLFCVGGARKNHTFVSAWFWRVFKKLPILYYSCRISSIFGKVEAKSPKFSALAPSALANIFLLFCVAGARQNHTFVSAWFWRVFKKLLVSYTAVRVLWVLC